jgi:hypothetical protein
VPDPVRYLLLFAFLAHSLTWRLTFAGGGVLKGVKADLWLTGELGHVSYFLYRRREILANPLPPSSQHEILAANAEGIHVLVCTFFFPSSLIPRPFLSCSLRQRDSR